MPIDIAKLLPFSDKEAVFDASRTLYQQKVGLFLFAAIATRSNIAFAVSMPSWLNWQLGKIHHEVANQVFYYILGTQNYCIYYRGEIQDILSFVYADDASFADNLLDGKSFQGYIMKLIGSAIA